MSQASAAVRYAPTMHERSGARCFPVLQRPPHTSPHHTTRGDLSSHPGPPSQCASSNFCWPGVFTRPAGGSGDVGDGGLAATEFGGVRHTGTRETAPATEDRQLDRWPRCTVHLCTQLFASALQP
ncbi:unnamed protein product [Periconia digitata]|uniref:Uncharacterized protein n=1 Tax=Periconia digitata TaxID=1303443 RepID=A0A9W4UNR7_9PLEO|nr:unnamed protein product [Periconia digitata]